MKRIELQLATAMASLLLCDLKGLSAQNTPAPPPTPTPTAVTAQPEQEKKETVRFRPIESNVIINLPSVETPPGGTLTLLVTHRFEQPLQDGDIHNFFTLDSGNTWGFGLWYAPVNRLNIGFYRSSNLDVYEASAQWEPLRLGGFGLSLRAGEDWRTQPGVASPHSNFFVQGILAYSFGPYVRLTAVPTYLQRTNGSNQPYINTPPPPHDLSCRRTPSETPTFLCSGLYDDVFNVPAAISIALTHSITIHGEVTPRLGKYDSRGVGWAVTLEKSLLRHRFAFFAGNQRTTTVDQYTVGIPYAGSPTNIYIGFNLYRAMIANVLVLASMVFVT